MRICAVVASVAALTGLLGSCRSPLSPTGSEDTVDLTISTDRSTYSLTTDSTAEPLLINRGSVRVYLPMNEYVAVQRFEAGAWSEPRPWFAVDGVGISFPLEPGDTLRSWPMSFAYVDRTPGVYRFIFEIAKNPNGRPLLSESQRISPPFELTGK
jgi:hypothetical protein